MSSASTGEGKRKRRKRLRRDQLTRQRAAKRRAYNQKGIQEKPYPEVFGRIPDAIWENEAHESQIREIQGRICRPKPVKKRKDAPYF